MNWTNLGQIEILKKTTIQKIVINDVNILLTFQDEKFGAISSTCNHAGGPLENGCLKEGQIVCPWHNKKFDRLTGESEKSPLEDNVALYDLKEENGHLFINLEPKRETCLKKAEPHKLARKVIRKDGPLRVLGISTTIMDRKNPRYSTSEELLNLALSTASGDYGLETKLITLDNLKFRHCEGYYSKNEKACTWPCSITQMDNSDEMEEVYEALVHWADIVFISTSIRWGVATSLYQKMVERLNCIQNQITINNNVLIKNKVAGFIITGAHDNIMAVAGQMLNFFSMVGFNFPQFPYVGHSLGWAAEQVDKNIAYVTKSVVLKAEVKDLVKKSVEMSNTLLGKSQIKTSV